MASRQRRTSSGLRAAPVASTSASASVASRQVEASGHAVVPSASGRRRREDDDADAVGRFIDSLFDRAVDIVQTLPKSGVIQTSYNDKLLLYSLFKQASFGNNASARPGLLDMLGRAKWDAWSKRRDVSPADAKRLYVDTLIRILKGYRDSSHAVSLINELESFTDPTALVTSGHSIRNAPTPAGPRSSSSRDQSTDDDESTSEGSDDEGSVPPAAFGPYVSKSQLPAPVEIQHAPSDRISIPDSARVRSTARDAAHPSWDEDRYVGSSARRRQSYVSVGSSTFPPPTLQGPRSWSATTPAHLLSGIQTPIGSSSLPSGRYLPPPPPQTLGLPPPPTSLYSQPVVANPTLIEIAGPLSLKRQQETFEKALDGVQIGLVALEERLSQIERRSVTSPTIGEHVTSSTTGSSLLDQLLRWFGLVDRHREDGRLTKSSILMAILTGLLRWLKRVTVDVSVTIFVLGLILRWKRGEKVLGIGWTSLLHWIFGQSHPIRKVLTTNRHTSITP